MPVAPKADVAGGPAAARLGSGRQRGWGMRLIVIIVTADRRAVLGQALAHIEGQTRRPDRSLCLRSRRDARR